MLTRKAKYALRALTYLANKGSQEPVLIAELAREEKIPKKFLERILLEMKRQGLLRSQKGRGGGYALGRRADKIIVGEVIRLMDGPLAPVSCVSETAYAPCKECNNEGSCGIRSVMKEVRDAMAEILDRASLADLIRREREAAKAGSLNYEI